MDARSPSLRPAMRRKSSFPPQPQPRERSIVMGHGTRSRTGFDTHDLAPEDRMEVGALKKQDPVNAVFGPYAPVVKGSFILHGCNFAKLEGVGKGVRRARFLDGLRDDIICEVGNGVRKEDILLNVLPGEIRSRLLLLRRSPRSGSSGSKRRSVSRVRSQRRSSAA
eukprot:Hpha_TRINITY_DN13366_c0_g1::TRINITY_DN13366_c0_g1_i1::g.95184::m.95184